MQRIANENLLLKFLNFTFMQTMQTCQSQPVKQLQAGKMDFWNLIFIDMQLYNQRSHGSFGIQRGTAIEALLYQIIK